MTQRDLEKVKRIDEQLVCAKSRYEMLALDIATSSTKAIDGMPHTVTNNTKSPTEDKGIKLAEASRKVKRKERELKEARAELRAKLAEEEEKSKEKNVLLTLVIEYRAVLLYDWNKIAKSFNGRFTAEYLRQLYHRYKNKLPEK